MLSGGFFMRSEDASQRARTEPDYLSTWAAARRLGCHSTTVIRALERGRLRGHRTPGGHWRVLVGDVERMRQPVDVKTNNAAGEPAAA